MVTIPADSNEPLKKELEEEEVIEFFMEKICQFFKSI